jgi:hypothetical protein
MDTTRWAPAPVHHDSATKRRTNLFFSRTRLGGPANERCLRYNLRHSRESGCARRYYAVPIVIHLFRKSTFLVSGGVAFFALCPSIFRTSNPGSFAISLILRYSPLAPFGFGSYVAVRLPPSVAVPFWDETNRYWDSMTVSA